MTTILILYTVIFIGLGSYTYYKLQNRITQIFLVFNAAFAIWSISTLLQEPKYVLFIPVNFVSQVQLIAALMICNAIFYFCYFYPDLYTPPPFYLMVNCVNALLLTASLYGILFTELVTIAMIIDGQTHYADGPGFTLLVIYEGSLCLASVGYLFHSYYKYPTYRQQITYLLVGFGVFYFMAWTSAGVLPIFGEYDYMMVGYLSSVLVPMCMAYAMLKYKLFDMVIVIKQHTAKIITLVLLAISFLLVFYIQTISSIWAGRLSIMLLSIFWGLSFEKIQTFITTAARRKFVTGGYDDVKLLEQISLILEKENNREVMFEQITQNLDYALEVERYSILLATRESNDKISHYTVTEINHDTNPLSADHPSISYFKDCFHPVTLITTPNNLHLFFKTQGYAELKNTLAIPFIANDQLEAIIILGERSTGLGYSDRDIAVIKQIVNNTNPVFYRLTPMEVLERQYINAKENLHNAEAQRIKEVTEQNILIEKLLFKKNEMFANISHELRTPLTLIRGPINRLKKKFTHIADRHTLEIAERNIDRLSTLVEQLLTLSRAQQLENTGEHSQVVQYLSKTASQLYDSFQTIATIQKIEFIHQIKPDIHVMAIERSIEDILINLLSNAFKYTPSGGRVIFSVTQDKKTAVISVKDTGVGIASDQFKSIFERFNRQPNAYRQQVEGVGLGLALVKQWVDQHHWLLHLASKEGKGSEFQVAIPIATKPKSKPHRSNNSILLAKESYQQIDYLQTILTHPESDPLLKNKLFFESSRKKHLLIIDDTRDMLQYLCELLRPEFECIFAEDGERGLILAKKQPPDLIICDVMMPGLSGFDVLDQLREDLLTSHIPILMLTAKGDKKSRLDGLNKLADDYITKPFDEDELIVRIQSILSLQKLRQDKLRCKLLNESITPSSKKPILELTPRDKAFIKDWETTVEKYYSDESVNVEKLASYMHISAGHLLDKLKALIGKGPKDFLVEYRIVRAKHMLVTEPMSISEIAEAVGFNNQRHFSTSFKKITKVTPSEFRRSPPTFV